ncbi:hypothetical protein GEMRC1_004659 [Eukaryota sp. GEM-RC1]
MQLFKNLCKFFPDDLVNQIDFWTKDVNCCQTLLSRNDDPVDLLANSVKALITFTSLLKPLDSVRLVDSNDQSLSNFLSSFFSLQELKRAARENSADHIVLQLFKNSDDVRHDLYKALDEVKGKISRDHPNQILRFWVQEVESSRTAILRKIQKKMKPLTTTLKSLVLLNRFELVRYLAPELASLLDDVNNLIETVEATHNSSIICQVETLRQLSSYQSRVLPMYRDLLLDLSTGHLVTNLLLILPPSKSSLLSGLRNLVLKESTEEKLPNLNLSCFENVDDCVEFFKKVQVSNHGSLLDVIASSICITPDSQNSDEPSSFILSCYIAFCYSKGFGFNQSYSQVKNFLKTFASPKNLVLNDILKYWLTIIQTFVDESESQHLVNAKSVINKEVSNCEPTLVKFSQIPRGLLSPSILHQIKSCRQNLKQLTLELDGVTIHHLNSFRESFNDFLHDYNHLKEILVVPLIPNSSCNLLDVFRFVEIKDRPIVLLFLSYCYLKGIGISKYSLNTTYYYSLYKVKKHISLNELVTFWNDEVISFVAEQELAEKRKKLRSLRNELYEYQSNRLSLHDYLLNYFPREFVRVIQKIDEIVGKSDCDDDLLEPLVSELKSQWNSIDSSVKILHDVKLSNSSSLFSILNDSKFDVNQLLNSNSTESIQAVINYCLAFSFAKGLGSNQNLLKSEKFFSLAQSSDDYDHDVLISYWKKEVGKHLDDSLKSKTKLLNNSLSEILNDLTVLRRIPNSLLPSSVSVKTRQLIGSISVLLEQVADCSSPSVLEDLGIKFESVHSGFKSHRQLFSSCLERHPSHCKFLKFLTRAPFSIPELRPALSSGQFCSCFKLLICFAYVKGIGVEKLERKSVELYETIISRNSALHQLIKSNHLLDFWNSELVSISNHIKTSNLKNEILKMTTEMDSFSEQFQSFLSPLLKNRLQAAIQSIKSCDSDFNLIQSSWERFLSYVSFLNFIELTPNVSLFHSLASPNFSVGFLIKSRNDSYSPIIDICIAFCFTKGIGIAQNGNQVYKYLSQCPADYDYDRHHLIAYWRDEAVMELKRFEDEAEQLRKKLLAQIDPILKTLNSGGPELFKFLPPFDYHRTLLAAENLNADITDCHWTDINDSFDSRLSRLKKKASTFWEYLSCLYTEVTYKNVSYVFATLVKTNSFNLSQLEMEVFNQQPNAKVLLLSFLSFCFSNEVAATQNVVKAFDYWNQVELINQTSSIQSNCLVDYWDSTIVNTFTKDSNSIYAVIEHFQKDIQPYLSDLLMSILPVSFSTKFNKIHERLFMLRSSVFVQNRKELRYFCSLIQNLFVEFRNLTEKCWMVLTYDEEDKILSLLQDLKTTPTYPNSIFAYSQRNFKILELLKLHVLRNHNRSSQPSPSLVAPLEPPPHSRHLLKTTNATSFGVTPFSTIDLNKSGRKKRQQSQLLYKKAVKFEVRGDFFRAKQYYMEAVDHGHAKSWFILGLFRSGLHELPLENKAAARALLRSSQLGYVLALRLIDKLKGDGPPRESSESPAILAAERGLQPYEVEEAVRHLMLMGKVVLSKDDCSDLT